MWFVIGYKRVCIAGRWTYWIVAGVTAALMAAGVAGGAGALLFQGIGFIIAQVLGKLQFEIPKIIMRLSIYNDT